MDVPNQIITRREKLHLSINKCSQRAEVNWTTWRDWETGDAAPSLCQSEGPSTLERAAKALGCTPADLVA